MTQEKYIQWNPISNTPIRIVSEALYDDYDGFKIILKEQGNMSEKRIVITFDPVIAYRNMDESYRLRTFNEHDYRKGSFFIVENSRWIKWLHEESDGMYKKSEIKHYSFFTLNECIDVLAEFPPDVSWEI